MNPKTKELWRGHSDRYRPCYRHTARSGFMFLSLWLAGTPINSSFSLEWIKVALPGFFPMWVTLAVLAVATIITGIFF